MWRNADVFDFIGWLRQHNERSGGVSVGFYGLDLYSMYASMAFSGSVPTDQQLPAGPTFWRRPADEATYQHHSQLLGTVT